MGESPGHPTADDRDLFVKGVTSACGRGNIKSGSTMAKARPYRLRLLSRSSEHADGSVKRVLVANRTKCAGLRGWWCPGKDRSQPSGGQCEDRRDDLSIILTAACPQGTRDSTVGRAGLHHYRCVETEGNVQRQGQEPIRSQGTRGSH